MTDSERRRSRRLRLVGRFQEFFALESSSGLLLLGAAAVALVWANSPAAGLYDALWETRISLEIGGAGLSKSLHAWINDGLMAVFFFVVGLEIKREVRTGELSTAGRAALPLAAALGGVLVPAGIFLALNAGLESARGWGIPMATDIAFALGVLALLGKRIPASLAVFLAALAIADDLAAVAVIAIFYTAGLSWAALAAAGVVLGLLLLLNRAGVQRASPYALLGVLLWLAFLASGIHATVAGVALALAVPAERRIEADVFLDRGRELLRIFEAESASDSRSVRTRPTGTQRTVLTALKETSRELEAPLDRLEHRLHPWVAFGVVPLFALANAGVSLGTESLSALDLPLAAGVAVGLLAGKPLGVVLASWTAVRLGLAELPGGVTWRHLVGVGFLCGIGFTMSLFIAGLALGEGTALASAKIGILGGSVAAGGLGWTILRRSGGPAAPEPGEAPGS